jgi:hypothetical protein
LPVTGAACGTLLSAAVDRLDVCRVCARVAGGAGGGVPSSSFVASAIDLMLFYAGLDAVARPPEPHLPPGTMALSACVA